MLDCTIPRTRSTSMPHLSASMRFVSAKGHSRFAETGSWIPEPSPRYLGTVGIATLLMRTRRKFANGEIMEICSQRSAKTICAKRTLSQKLDCLFRSISASLSIGMTNSSRPTPASTSCRSFKDSPLASTSRTSGCTAPDWAQTPGLASDLSVSGMGTRRPSKRSSRQSKRSGPTFDYTDSVSKRLRSDLRLSARCCTQPTQWPGLSLLDGKGAAETLTIGAKQTTFVSASTRSLRSTEIK